MARVIQKLDRVNGVKFWCQDFKIRTPRMEVFRVVGQDAETHLIYFKSLKEQSVIARYPSQLGENGFHPFILDGGHVQPPPFVPQLRLEDKTNAPV